MSTEKMGVPGFGIGAFNGTPTTVGLAATSTITMTGTSYLMGQYFVTGLATGANVSMVSTTNAVTGTWIVLNGAPGYLVHDGASGRLINTTTSQTIVFITM